MDVGKSSKIIVRVLFFCVFFIAFLVNTGEVFSKIFSTWDVFELDKCASIWLIKRFIDPEAEIKFFPKGTIISEGTPFDTPEAELRRYHNMSTFECFLKFYDIKDPKLHSIGKIIHDIEINIWEKKAFTETLNVQNAILSIIDKSESLAVIVEETSRYFDSLYERIAPDLTSRNS